MSVDELKVLEWVFLSTVLSFFVLALPIYAWLRRSSPEIGWHWAGNVSTSALKELDLVVAGAYVLLFTGFLKAKEAQLAHPSEVELSAAGVLGSGVAMLCLASLVPAVLFFRTNLREFFGLRWLAWPHVFWIMPAFVFGILLVAFGFMATGWKEWVEGAFGSEPQEAIQMLQESNDVAFLVAMAISAVIIAPIAEEIIFRGYLYPVAKRFTDRWFAAVFTGIFFGVIHFNLYSLPILSLMGIVLALIYEKTGSLWSVIGCHAAFNGLQVGGLLLSKIYQFPEAP